MSIFRSYYAKNSTLIKDNRTNNSQNPVTEIFYGTSEAIPSRFLFKIDLAPLIQKLNDEGLTKNNITKHNLFIGNSIVSRPDLLGGTMPDLITQRASSFSLQLFTITQDWDEGNGYDFLYKEQLAYPVVQSASNWFDRKTNILWAAEGAFTPTGVTGVSASTILYTQNFDNGNENVNIDLTTYINQILFSGRTDFGLGLKLPNSIEVLITDDRKSVGFFTKYTNTFFEPYLETTFNDSILDDRKFFYLDKTNQLFLYIKKGNVFQDGTINSVIIYDHNDKIVQTITGSSISRVRKGIYKISISIDSALYPDAVMFRDVWNVTVNSKTKNIEQDFYLIHQDEYINFNKKTYLNSDNFHFNYVGIKSNEIFKRGDIRNIIINIKQLYSGFEDQILDLQYRIYVKQGSKVEINVVDYTSVNRTIRGYEFDVDTSWMIPNEYYLELKLNYNNSFEIKSPIKFRIQSESRFFGLID